MILPMIIFGCGSEYIRNPDKVAIPLPSKAVSLPSADKYKAFATIDESTEEYELTISNGQASGIISNVSTGAHKVTVHFQYQITYTDRAKYIDIATAELSVDVTNEGALASITDDLYAYPDQDADGYSNLQEILDQTNPEVKDHSPTTLLFGGFTNSRDECMGNSDYYNNCKYYCGNYKSSYIDNPFNTKNITIYLTDSYEDANGCIRATADSKWSIVDSDENDVVEYDYSDDYASSYIYDYDALTDPWTTPGTKLTELQVNFTLSDGLNCTGSITLGYNVWTRDMVLDCTKDANTCTIDYEGYD